MMDATFTREFNGITTNLDEITKELQRLKKFEKYKVFSNNYDAFSIIRENLFYYLDSIKEHIGDNHHEFNQFRDIFVNLFNDLQIDYQQHNLLKLYSHYKARVHNLKKITQDMEKKLEKNKKELLIEFFTLLDSMEKFFSKKTIIIYERTLNFSMIQKTINTYYHRIFSNVRELFLNYGYNSITFKKFLNDFEKTVNSIIESCIDGDFFENKDIYIAQIQEVVKESKKIKKG